MYQKLENQFLLVFIIESFPNKYFKLGIFTLLPKPSYKINQEWKNGPPHSKYYGLIHYRLGLKSQ